MATKIKCNCGEEFDYRMQWIMHYQLSRPSIPRKSRLTKISEDKILDAQHRQIEYDKLHYIQGEK